MEGALHGCTLCGHVYDAAVGDPDHGIPPGTRFADLPRDWRCPRCGADQQEFIPFSPPTAPVARS